MSWNSTICGKCRNGYDFYGRLVPACPHCGYPELKSSGEEYCRSMGVDPTPKPASHWKQLAWNCFRLMTPTGGQDFADYDALYQHCVKNGIDASPV